jgi:hypothetical protein
VLIAILLLALVAGPGTGREWKPAKGGKTPQTLTRGDATLPPPDPSILA